MANITTKTSRSGAARSMGSPVTLSGLPLTLNIGHTRADVLNIGMGQDLTQGNPASPSLKMDRKGKFRFRWTVAVGVRTISVSVLQALNTSPRPTLTIKASSDLGVAADVVATAGSSATWITIGPATVTVTTAGVLIVELANLQPGYAACNWDNLVTT